MTEAESLLEIANAIKALAAAVGALAPPLWLILIFKDMGGGNKSALKEIAEAIQNNAGRNAG
ncbi:MAG: hypothetical protein JSW27_24155 [Phycisphaerales bacterium]|nr:MAG: hypothetical protein JSW27_24155 [Phycisphaerales bacterium]